MMKNRNKLFFSIVPLVIFGVVVSLFILKYDNPLSVNLSKQEDTFIWEIGKQDGLSTEFRGGFMDSLEFVIGEDVISQKFPSGHQGNLIADKSETYNHPYKIYFDLDELQYDKYELNLHLIYRDLSPKNVEIDINNHKGSFPIEYEYKQDLNDWEGNSPLLTKQNLSIRLDRSVLKNGKNYVSIFPTGYGSMQYDAINFKGVRPEDVNNENHLNITPSVFYKKIDDQLMELIKLEILFEEPFKRGEVVISYGDQIVTHEFTNEFYDFGKLSEEFYIPAVNEAVEMSIDLKLDDKSLSKDIEYSPAKKWKFFIAARVHNDVGYTDLQPNVNELDTRNTDIVLNVLDKYPFYKFNFETSWLVENYLKSRNIKYQKKYLEHARNHRASNNAFYLNLLTGLCSGEELYRATYFSHNLHEKENSDFKWASLTDAPSHSWFLPTLLDDVGVIGFANGSNQTRAPILRFSNLNEDSPYYWEGINGEKILMWYARSYLQFVQLTYDGNWTANPNYEVISTTLPQFLSRYERDDYIPDAVLVYGAYVDNALIPQDAGGSLVEKWNSEYEYPKLIMASDGDFYDYIDENFKNNLKTYKGDAGAYWEDGAGSTSIATKVNRETKVLLPIAETAASLSSILMPRYHYNSELFNKAWKNILFYDEHTWGAHNSISQPELDFVKQQWEIKEDYSLSANLNTRTELTRTLNRLSQLFEVRGNSLVAFNFQPYERSGILSFELQEGLKLFDLENNTEVEYQTIERKDGYQVIKFLAENVPGMGYKGYELRPREVGTKLNENNTIEFSNKSENIIENDWYKITFDAKKGGLISLVDKEFDREIFDNTEYLGNEYIYVEGGENSKVLRHGMGVPPANLKIHKPSNFAIVDIISSDIGDQIIVESQSKNTPLIKSTYQLYNHEKRIDITNEIIKDEINDKEGVYFAFPFKAKFPEFKYQIQNGWVRPNIDQLPGAAREWFSSQNLTVLNDDDFAIALSTPDAPLITLTDINRGLWPKHLNIDNGYAFSYVMNNYWFTNYKAAQGGDFKFRYSITSGTNLDDKKLSEFDRDTRTPIIGYPLISSFSASVASEGRPLALDKGKFIEINNPDIEFVVLKKAEIGDGWILRLKNMSGEIKNVKIRLPLMNIDKAYLANGVEVIKSNLTINDKNEITVTCGGNKYTTIRLELSPSYTYDF